MEIVNFFNTSKNSKVFLVQSRGLRHFFLILSLLRQFFCVRKMSELKPCIPLPLDEKVLVEVVEKAKDWALMHGAAMRSKTAFSPDALQVCIELYLDVDCNSLLSFSLSSQFAPFILTPTLFPRHEFEKAVRLQAILNELMHWVAHDTEFLRDTLANTIIVDEFTRNLYNIYERILAAGGPAQVCPTIQINEKSFFFLYDCLIQHDNNFTFSTFYSFTFWH